VKVSLCLSQLSEDMFSSRISVTDVPARAFSGPVLLRIFPVLESEQRQGRDRCCGSFGSDLSRSEISEDVFCRHPVRPLTHISDVLQVPA